MFGCTECLLPCSRRTQAAESVGAACATTPSHQSSWPAGTAGPERGLSRSAAAELTEAAGATTPVHRLALQHILPKCGGLVPRITYCVTFSPHCPASGTGYWAMTQRTTARGFSPCVLVLTQLEGAWRPSCDWRPAPTSPLLRLWLGCCRAAPFRVPGFLAVAQTALQHCGLPGRIPVLPTLEGPGVPAATRRPRRRRGWNAAGQHPPRAPDPRSGSDSIAALREVQGRKTRSS